MSLTDRGIQDTRMLDALIGHDQLTELERTAFPGMRYRLIPHGPQRELTSPQRDWVENRYHQLELDAEEPPLNLHSAGLVPTGIPIKKSDGERFAANVLTDRPKKPPGKGPAK